MKLYLALGFLLALSKSLSADALKCYQCVYVDGLPRPVAGMEESCYKAITPNEKLAMECKRGEVCANVNFKMTLPNYPKQLRAVHRGCVKPEANHKNMCEKFNKHELLTNKDIPQDVKDMLQRLNLKEINGVGCVCDTDLCNQGNGKTGSGGKAAPVFRRYRMSYY